MFEFLKIKRLQKEILKRGRYEQQIDKSVEEFVEILEELEKFSMQHHPYIISDSDLKKNVGNMQKEIADVENIICKLKMMFIQTPEQRAEYRASKAKIVRALKIYLEAVR